MPTRDAVPHAQLLEVDRWALARAAQLQAEIAAHYEKYEFQPVATKLQLFCSEDLGAFWLDVLKDRLYTTAPKSLARRSAQTALWHVTHAMLRWMSPFLSFTAEEAWQVLAPGKSVSIFCETFVDAKPWLDDALLAKWQRIREIRDVVNQSIEAVRAAGGVGSSLQAEIVIAAPPADRDLLAALGDDLRFVTITSQARVVGGRCAGGDGHAVVGAQVRALLALARRRRCRSAASIDLRALRQQPVRRG